MATNPTHSPAIWKASQLRALPRAERDAILAEAALRAENQYRTDRTLTDFEAFGKDDVHGESNAATEG